MSVKKLKTVLKDIDQAKGLPNEHYICPQTYKLENNRLFFKTWAAIAFEADVKNPGQAFPVNFLGVPLLVINNKENSIKVFQNTCRHRGMILIDKPTTLKGPIRCPYHSWSYDYKGNLIRTPYVGGVGIDSHQAINNEKLGLFQIRSFIWQGVIFINLSGDAPAFEETHCDIMARWKEFNQPYHLGGPVSQFEIEVATNWKLAIENYCESYHLPWVHPELNEISPINEHYNIENRNFSGQGSRNYKQLVGMGNKKFPDFKNLSSKWQSQAEYLSFFPNVLFGVHRDHSFAILLMPQGPENTTERVAIFYSKDLIFSEWKPMLKENARIWKNVFTEDIDVVEGMQKGRHGPMYDGGKCSPVMDGPTHYFHKWVAEKMLRKKNKIF
jgi:choline monooxygenase